MKHLSKEKPDVKKVQIWVSADIKQDMEEASHVHAISWTKFIRREIQEKLNELKQQATPQ